MDLGEIFIGLRTIREPEIERFAERKLVALRSAYRAVHGNDPDRPSFSSFVDAAPPSVLRTYFGSDGVDQHYTRLFGGLAQGERNFDAVLALTINYLLGELTYQGRYLAKYEPEPLIVAGGDTFLLGVALANAEKIEAFKLGAYDEADQELQARMRRLALNARPLVWGDPETLAKAVTTGLGRPLGCLALLDLGLPDQSPLSYDNIITPLERHLTPDTFHLFAGEAAVVFDVRRQLHAQFPDARFLHRAYALDRDGAEMTRSVLVATRLDRPAEITIERATREYRFCRRGTDFAFAEGLTSFAVRDDELVAVRAPLAVASSAPLPASQIDTITRPLSIAHRMTRLQGGRVINASTIFAQTYVIATSAGQIFEEMHLDDLIRNTPYGTPDATGMITVPARETAHVVGPALLFSFTPAVITYHSHFLLQCFPRVITAEHLDVAGMRLLVPSTIRSYQRRMLEMAGWDASRLVTMDPQVDYLCEDLYVPNVAPAIFSPFQAAVYDRLISQVEPRQERPKRRIIISRAARTTWRNMVNYDAVCDLLVRDCGFEVVEPDKLSIEDEIRLFQESAIVVGAEGAGLYNCCFMAPGTDVIVLADQDYVMYVVGSMAAIRDFDVSFVFGETFQAERDLSRRAGHTDFVLDPVRVKQMTEEVIRRKGFDRQGVA